MKSRVLAGSAAALLTVAALGCETRTIGFATTGPSVGSARIRLFNAVTSATAVDFLVDGLVVASGVPFGGASAYAGVSLGSHRLQVRVSNTSTFLVDFTRDISTTGSFSLLPTGGLGDSGALFFADDPTSVAGQTRLRIVHAAAAAGPVSVYVTAPGAPLAGTTPLATAVPFGAVSSYLPVAPGQYQVRVTRAGVESEVLLDTGTITFGSGAVRTLLLTDAPGGGSPPSVSIVADAN